MPNISPVNAESWFEKASFHFGVGAQGFPAASRAPPRKKGQMSTFTPCASSKGRCFLMFVKPNQEYGDTACLLEGPKKNSGMCVKIGVPQSM